MNAPTQALMDGEPKIPRFTIRTESLEEFLSATGRSAADWQSEIDRTLRPISRELRGLSARLEAKNQSDASSSAQNVAG